MSVSLNSKNDSTCTEPTEAPADLSLDQDELLDVEMGLVALNGLTHSAACSATERSNRRFDDRNHRLHESRMKALGMEGDEQKPETDDMSQQVLIRSPVIHNHYSGNGKPAQQPTEPTAPTNSQPAQPASSGLSPFWRAAIAAGLIGGPAAGGLAAYMLRGGDQQTTVVNPVEQGDRFGVGLIPPGPPVRKTP